MYDNKNTYGKPMMSVSLRVYVPSLNNRSLLFHLKVIIGFKITFSFIAILPKVVFIEGQQYRIIVVSFH